MENPKTSLSQVNGVGRWGVDEMGEGWKAGRVGGREVAGLCIGPRGVYCELLI